MSIEEENSIIVNEAQLFPRFPANMEGNKNPPKPDAKMVTNPSTYQPEKKTQHGHRNPGQNKSRNTFLCQTNCHG